MPKLLSGGNPQIAKADGDAPVQACIDAMPGWKSDLGHRLDSLVTKAVKWNSPFQGIALRSAPPAGSPSTKTPPLDEAQLTAWIQQAAALPGWDPSAKK